MKLIVWHAVALGALSSVLVVTLARDRYGLPVAAYAAMMLAGMALVRFVGWALVRATQPPGELDPPKPLGLREQVRKHRPRAFRTLDLLEWAYVTGCLFWSFYRLSDHSMMPTLWLALGLTAAACAADAAAEIALNRGWPST